MELTGLQIKNMQMLEDLKKTIKEFEIERIENDLFNMNKNEEFYEVYYRLLDSIIKFYLELGYSIDEAITMAINIIREVEISKYEY